MPNSFLIMKIDKKKLLGQFFSGNKIAEMIEALIPSAGICSVIDPMCGIGDLLLPFSNTANVTGIEIDKELRDELTKRLPNAFCISSNAFTIQTLSRLNYGGYDLVVTNPPYIRKELIGRAEETNLSLMEICSNLHLFADKFSTLNKEEKLIMHSAIDSVSGLSDMSIPSWLLCIMLVKKGGKFAIVLPNSWLSREYSQPILSLIDELFDVNYVVNDVNGVWFKGNALVRTSIIIASRKPSNYTNTCIVDLYKSAQNDACLLKLYDEVIKIPFFIVRESNGANLFDSILDIAYDCIHDEISLNEIKKIAEGRIGISSLSNEEQESCYKFLFDLYKTIRTLDLKGQNGIWSFVLKNTLRPTLVAANFNGIVSNTPWLSLSKLGNNPYHIALKKLGRTLHIHPTGASAPHVELATIFLVNSIKRYLVEGGVFGCILPHSVLAGNNHTPFRLGHFSSIPIKLNPECIWELPANTFKNKAISIFGHKSNYIQTDTIEGAAVFDKDTVEDTKFYAQRSGNLYIWTNKPSDLIRQDFSFYQFQQGADIMPRFLFFFDLQSVNDNFRLSKLSLTGNYGYFLKDLKKGKNFCPPAILINKKYFFDILISNVLTPFNISTCPKALLPITNDSGAG